MSNVRLHHHRSPAPRPAGRCPQRPVRHMLADGYDIVMDLQKSQGLVGLRLPPRPQGPRLLHQLRLLPHRLQPSRGSTTRSSASSSPRSRMNKPANSDIYTTYMAEFVETFARLAVPPPYHKHMFFVEGGALGDRERHQDGLRLEDPQELHEGLQEREGARRSCTSARPSTAAAATRCR